MKKYITLILLIISYCFVHAGFDYNNNLLLQDSTKQCNANFNIRFYSNLPYQVYFENSSLVTDNNFYSSWNFGDSVYSTERSPIHIYKYPGKYRVCLTIENTVNSCINTICDSVAVPQNYSNINCSAEFSILYDSVFTNEISVKFLNLSRAFGLNPGEIIKYNWSFGDGSESFEKSPIHKYIEPDFYNISLIQRIVLKTDTNKIICESNFSRNNIAIGKPRICNFGGQVFKGDFPLKHGKAEIYRIKANKSIIPLKTMQFDTLGYFYFYQIIEGNYIVKIIPPDNNYFPTYFGNEISWTKAQKVNLRKNIFNSDIHLFPVPVNKVGKGQISGLLSSIDSTHQATNNVEIILADKNSNPLNFTMTDQQGNYRFNNLPFGTYMLYADKIGWFGLFQTVTLSENNQSDIVNLSINSNPVNDIENNNGPEPAIIELYPNPVMNELNLNIYLQNPAALEIEIFDFTGKKVGVSKINLAGTKSKITFNISWLDKGIYFLRASNISSGTSVLKKFIKY